MDENRRKVHRGRACALFLMGGDTPIPPRRPSGWALIDSLRPLVDILVVTLHAGADGGFVRGRAVPLIGQLSSEDFGSDSAARLSSEGEISTP